MWMVLTLNFHISNIFIGIAVSFSVSLLYVKLFSHKAFEFISPFWLIVYLFVLLKNLVLSNIRISKRILSRDMKLSPAIVAVKTDLKSDWKKLMLANSITLTPGTLTLDVKDDTLFIHDIEYHEDTDKEEITKEFEDVIAMI
jgi:multicomponent Na+:H+ antiporter subunit E